MFTKKPLFLFFTLLVTNLITSCEWNTDESFNTEEGEGGGFVEVNVNGTYEGAIGGAAVDPTSGSTITRITVQRNGEDLTMTDNLGNTYVGTISFPLSELTGSETSIVPNTILASSQLTATGVDSSTGMVVQIAGTIQLLSDELNTGGGTINTTLVLSGDWITAGEEDPATLQAVKDGGLATLADFY